MKLTQHSACAAAGLLFAMSNTADAGVITFTDRIAWESAVSGATIQQENFDGAAVEFAENSIGNDAGLVSVDLIGGVGDSGPTGLTGDGFFMGEVDASPITPDRDGLKLAFRTGDITGFGLLGLRNDSSSSPDQLELEEIGLVVGGQSFLVSDILGLTTHISGEVPSQDSLGEIPFIGFVLDAPITSFEFVHGDLVRPVSGGNEEFYLDGLVLASANQGPVSVSEPATGVLLGFGLLGLAVLRRREQGE